MQLVAALDQVERHRLAHDAEPDETDLHGGNLPLGCAVDWVDSTRSAWPRQAFPAGPGQAGADSDRASRSAVRPRGSFSAPISSWRRHIAAYTPSFAHSSPLPLRPTTPPASSPRIGAAPTPVATRSAHPRV